MQKMNVKNNYLNRAARTPCRDDFNISEVFELDQVHKDSNLELVLVGRLPSKKDFNKELCLMF